MRFPFSLTHQPTEEDLPALCGVLGEPEIDLRAGAYAGGLISIVNVEDGIGLLRSWRWLVSDTAVAVFTTAFGDLFLWEERRGLSFLEVQRSEITFADREISWVLTDFLLDPKVQSDVLRRPRFEELRQKFGELRYNEVFILEPWPVLGGQDRLEGYSKGSALVYLDLVGQALNQAYDRHTRH